VIQPEFRTLSPKKLIGKKSSMSQSNDNTGQLWHSFMMRRKEIPDIIGSDLYSLRVYPSAYWKNFSAENTFEKWALAEVSDHAHIPEGFEKFILPEGLYAVFLYKGLNTDPSIFRYIYGTWIHSSGYELDDRPHFEVLGKNYRNNDAESEEEIWIPVKKR
jgi:AraC family transcriptional regulator